MWGASRVGQTSGRLDARVHPLVLADDVLGALVLRRAQGAAVLRKAGAVDVAQVRHLGVAGSLRCALDARRGAFPDRIDPFRVKRDLSHESR